jgi:multidrug efflux pump subunit AcrA (membrane-fusion protein)
MSKRSERPWLNIFLGVLCLGAIVIAYTTVGQASQSAASSRRTATVAKGVVQSTVSGSGSLKPAANVSVNFGTTGTLTGVFVSVGDHVKSGQLLAEINPSAALSSLHSAEITLSTDKAAYQDAVKGLTPAEQHQAEIGAEQSKASVSSAKQSLRQDQQTAKSDESSATASVAQAEVSLTSTEQSVAVEARTQQDAVNQAISQRGTDERTITELKTQVEEARSLLAAERSKSPPSEQKVSAAESKLASSESSLKSAESKLVQDANSILSAQNNQAAGAVKSQQSIDSARNSVANAKRTKSSTKLKDEQTTAQARTSLASQELSLQSTLAANEVKSAPPKTSTVVSAEGSVKSARMTVEKARQTLAATKLYAPAEGVVASVKNTVGESVSGTGAEASSTSSGSGATSATGSSASGGGTSGAGGSGASSGTGASGSSGGTSATGKGANSGASSGGSGTSTGSGASGTGSSGAGSGSSASETGGRTTTSAGGGGGVFQTIANTSPSTSGSYRNIATSSSGGASAGGAGSASGSTGTGASATSSESSSTSSSSFIELVDVQGYQVVVPLSESEIGNVHVGQIATVTVEALEGRKLAAQVASLAVLSTSSSGAVSYDVTFQLEQTVPGLKPGMSATAEVVVKQAEGINVPTSAITGGSVTVKRGGKQVSQAVTTGLAGNSSTIILSGLKAGETVLLPATSSTGTSGASLTSKLAGRGGGLGGLGGGGGFPGGGFGGGRAPGG